MKASDRYKQLIKEMEPLLLKAPKHPWLTKWIKGLKADLKDMRAKRNSDALFMRFHKAYLKIGASDKDAGFDNWKIYVIDRDVDEEIVIKSVPVYGVWCKKQDRSVLNGERFLSKTAWEWVEVSEYVKKEASHVCDICRESTPSRNQIRCKKEGTTRVTLAYVCNECKKHDGKVVSLWMDRTS